MSRCVCLCVSTLSTLMKVVNSKGDSMMIFIYTKQFNNVNIPSTCYTFTYSLLYTTGICRGWSAWIWFELFHRDWRKNHKCTWCPLGKDGNTSGCRLYPRGRKPGWYSCCIRLKQIFKTLITISFLFLSYSWILGSLYTIH